MALEGSAPGTRRRRGLDDGATLDDLREAVATLGDGRAGTNLYVLRHRGVADGAGACLLYTSPSPRDATLSRMPSSA